MRFTSLSVAALSIAAAQATNGYASPGSGSSGSSSGSSVSGTTGKLGDAQQVLNNPAGAVYAAVLPNSEKTTVRGSVVASSVGGGQGVQFQVSVSGFPSEGGPFLYHIHDQPVPADGNCTGTLAHLDPYERGEDPVCDAKAPATCQVGDLSGKHGKIEGSGLSTTYQDTYAALVPGIGAFFGNRSIVFHFANKTRITCANFSAVAGGAGGPTTGTPIVPGNWSTATGIPYGNASTPTTPAGGAGGPTPTQPGSTTETGPAGTPLPSSGASAVRDTILGGAAFAAAFAAALL